MFIAFYNKIKLGIILYLLDTDQIFQFNKQKKSVFTELWISYFDLKTYILN